MTKPQVETSGRRSAERRDRDGGAAGRCLEPPDKGKRPWVFDICRRVPFPPDRGDKMAALNGFRHLAARHEMHVFCLGDRMQDLSIFSGLQA